MRSLDEIRATCTAATEGPWLADNPNSQESPLWQVTNDAYVNPTATNEGSAFGAIVECGSRADAEFIANARTDVPELLAAVDALKAKNAALESVARWVVMVGPSLFGVPGLVTLPTIIERAREALGEES